MKTPKKTCNVEDLTGLHVEGVKTIVGSHDAFGKNIVLVASRFNPEFTQASLESAIQAIESCGGRRTDLLIVRVPGAYEIPSVIEPLAARGLCDAAIAIGTVIEGATPHAQLINQTIANRLSEISSTHGLPVIDCVVAVHTEEQASERCLSGEKSRGWYGGLAAVEMVSVYEQLQGLR